jgi:hypothetical protein
MRHATPFFIFGLIMLAIAAGGYFNVFAILPLPKLSVTLAKANEELALALTGIVFVLLGGLVYWIVWRLDWLKLNGIRVSATITEIEHRPGRRGPGSWILKARQDSLPAGAPGDLKSHSIHDDPIRYLRGSPTVDVLFDLRNLNRYRFDICYEWGGNRCLFPVEDHLAPHEVHARHELVRVIRKITARELSVLEGAQTLFHDLRFRVGPCAGPQSTRAAS